MMSTPRLGRNRCFDLSPVYCRNVRRPELAWSKFRGSILGGADGLSGGLEQGHKYCGYWKGAEDIML